MSYNISTSCARENQSIPQTQINTRSYRPSIVFVSVCFMTCSSSLTLSLMSSSSFIFGYLGLHHLSAKGLIFHNTMQLLCQAQFQTVHEDKKYSQHIFYCDSTRVSVPDGMWDNAHTMKTKKKWFCCIFVVRMCMRFLGSTLNNIPIVYILKKRDREPEGCCKDFIFHVFLI